MSPIDWVHFQDPDALWTEVREKAIPYRDDAALGKECRFISLS